MDHRNAAGRASQPIEPDPGDPDAIEFVRFCYRRRRVGWPELYDEMCAVVGRGLYRGYAVEDLGRMGIGLTLFEMPALAVLVQRVVAEDEDRRRRSVQIVRPAHVVAEAEVTAATAEPSADPAPATLVPATPAAAADPGTGNATAEPSAKRSILVTLPVGA